MRALLAVIAMMTGSLMGAEIQPEEAKNHVGEMVTVRGVIAQVFVSRGANVFLNFGGKYPNQVFSADVLSKKTPRLISQGTGWLTEMEGKEVRVSGKVALYKGKPEIVLREREEIQVVVSK